jgi:hypothetical protein
MGMRRFTRLTNAFSRKVDNLAAAVSLHFMYYNFARPHMSLANRRWSSRRSPAGSQLVLIEGAPYGRLASSMA